MQGLVPLVFRGWLQGVYERCDSAFGDVSADVGPSTELVDAEVKSCHSLLADG